MSRQWPPGTDHTTQNFESRYTGSPMEPNTFCAHTTEGLSFPGYSSGATAPNLTVRINIAARTASLRGHYPADRSARALENRSGGVQTNTLNVWQVELVGTCDPIHKSTWVVNGRTYRAGVDYIYWPDAPDWALELVADIVGWLHEEWPDFPIEDGAPRGWLPYPKSYGSGNGQRMTFSEWNNGRGMVGHQHVPENSHGDPGDFDVDRVVALATGTTAPPVVVPPSTEGPFLDPNMFPRSGVVEGPQIVWLRKRLRIHLDALQLPNAWGTSDPAGDTWDENDRRNVATFQAAQGWTGDDADGYLGPITLQLLAAEPTVTPAPPVEPPVDQPLDYLDPANYPPNGPAHGEQIEWLGERVVVWSTALGLPAPYQVGPSDDWTEIDRAGVQAIQRVWWPNGGTELGGDADGYPGKETLSRLAADPPQVAFVDLSVYGHNVKATVADKDLSSFAKRVPAIMAPIKKHLPDVVGFVEAGNFTDQRPLYDAMKAAGYQRGAHAGRWRAVYYRLATMHSIEGRLFATTSGQKEADGSRDLKHAHGLLLEHRASGYVAKFVAFHIENQSGAGFDELRVTQSRELRAQVAAWHPEVPDEWWTGDSNSVSWVANDFEDHAIGGKTFQSADRHGKVSDRDRALDTLNKSERTPRKHGEHIDITCCPTSAEVVSWEQPVSIKDGRYVAPMPSDHNPTLTRARARVPEHP